LQNEKSDQPRRHEEHEGALRRGGFGTRPENNVFFNAVTFVASWLNQSFYKIAVTHHYQCNLLPRL
jgi:hypothetical protein